VSKGRSTIYLSPFCSAICPTQGLKVCKNKSDFFAPNAKLPKQLKFNDFEILAGIETFELNFIPFSMSSSTLFIIFASENCSLHF